MPVADRITEYEARVGAPVPDAVRQHFTGARLALTARAKPRRLRRYDVLLAQALADILGSGCATRWWLRSPNIASH
ncbi:hypothetical protein [Streptomyces virginiae]|uniref:Uncharacterized protein n=1 Tax=Streptomyces virginiae TaxID=1961 RepID=A0ABZ1TNK4_STRVG|nr:hypothetical protein [Streptomyces virginiae]